MSKEFILNYVNGNKELNLFIIVYSVDVERNVIIHSCYINEGQNNHVLIKKNYDCSEIEVPEQVVIEAARDFYLKNAKGI